MSRQPKLSQADIARAVKGAQAAGLKVGRVEIEGDRIVIHSGEEAATKSMTTLETWRAGRGAR